jgi:hypothetical protein
MSLLEGDLAGEARAALADLSSELLRPTTSEVPDASLAGGLAGIALAHAALEPIVPGAGHSARAGEALRGAIARASREPLGLGLYRGLAGIGWVIAQLVEGPDRDRLCEPVDAALERALATSNWTGPFDLIAGLVGMGVYALERLPCPSGRRLVASIVRHLASTARPQAVGVAWASDPGWVGEPSTRRGMEWDLGVAHGVPGVIAFLARVVVAAEVDGDSRGVARTLLEGAVTFLLAQELRPEDAGCFGHAAGPHAPRGVARLAWCYGDAGIAVTLLAAARAAPEKACVRRSERRGVRGSWMRAFATARPDWGTSSTGFRARPVRCVSRAPPAPGLRGRWRCASQGAALRGSSRAFPMRKVTSAGEQALAS